MTYRWIIISLAVVALNAFSAGYAAHKGDFSLVMINLVAGGAVALALIERSRIR